MTDCAERPVSLHQVRWFPLVFLFAIGCLSSDPRSDGVSLAPDSNRDAASHLQAAPLSLDPAILKARNFGESPTLAKHVQSGSLTPVSERLPENPLVVIPMDEIGRYGGTLRRALTGDVVQTPGVAKTLGEGLMGFERPLPKSIQYNLAESHTFEDAGRIAIFNIREGIRWSDGVPFTVDDILFWYYDMIVDADARDVPLFPSDWAVDGKPIALSKVNDYTLRIEGPKPLGRILSILSAGTVAYPKHALARLHPKYNPEASYETFRDSTSRAQLLYRSGIPTLSAWMPVEWTRGQRIVYERNPYYWKVDSAGNQLPYADRLVFNIIPDTQIILLKFINGEIDLFGRYAQVNMFPTLKAEEPNGKFKIHLGGPVPVSTLRINWDTPRLPLRRAVRDLRVRVALSHAMNREEINQIVFHGLLKPGCFTFAPTSKYYSEEASLTYASYDPIRSQELLDSAGYLDSDGDGFREFEDGSVFALTIDVVPGMGVDVCQLIAEHWSNIGVKVTLNIALRDIIWPRRSAGENDMLWWWSYPEDARLDLHAWGHVGPNVPMWHRRAASEGPEWMHEATRLIEEAGATVDTSLVNRNMIRVRDLHTENAPVLTPGYGYHVWGASTRLGNVPEENTSINGYLGWSRPVFHEQLYVK
jgi:peptide/nickel transport system substrate-binding protein